MRIVEVVSYNPAWPEDFEEEALKIKQALGENCIAIHHIGSTSIPGISAKPIIDIIPVVRDIYGVNGEATRAMEALGYESRGELWMLFRRYFSNRTHHIHVWEECSDEITRNLLFRNYLRDHPGTREAYGDLKLGLAMRFRHDRYSYTLNKDDFIRDVVFRTGFNGYQLVEALTEREWEAYHRIRKQRIFDPIDIVYDPQHPSMTDEKNVHLVLSKGDPVVSVAQVEFLDPPHVALRSLATDGPYERQGHGRYLLTQIERWIKGRSCSTIHLHAAPEAVPFYKAMGYVEMAFDEPPLAPDSVAMVKVV